jgi:hypothetical protein
MRRRFYPAVAYGTLVVDAYLALASVATKATPREGHRYLPPFGFVVASEASRFLVLLVATWTAILALGCLSVSGEQRERPHAAAVLWFVLVSRWFGLSSGSRCSLSFSGSGLSGEGDVRAHGQTQRFQARADSLKGSMFHSVTWVIGLAVASWDSLSASSWK